MNDHALKQLISSAKKIAASTIDGEHAARFNDNNHIIETYITDLDVLARLTSQRQHDLKDIIDEQQIILAQRFNIN